MTRIKGVLELAKEFMKNARYVEIIGENVISLANGMLKNGITPFPPQTTGEDVKTICWKELVASSINYCYWYGKSDIRPGGCGSTLMYDLVNAAFDEGLSISTNINHLKKSLALNRFPLLEERVRHLKEVEKEGSWFIMNLTGAYGEEPDDIVGLFLDDLIERLPGFASDMFLKRASLFFLQLHRKLGWFKKGMHVLPVPADYAVPKMLKHFACMRYYDPLKTLIDTNQLVAKGSQMECEIRAATIVICKQLQEETGWSISDVDSWLWLRRKECNDPFHLTITTDY